MLLSNTLLFGLFLLCLCGFGNRVWRILQIDRGRAAALLLLCALLSQINLPLGDHVSVNLSFLLLAAAGFCIMGFQTETVMALLTAFAAGTIAWVLHALLPAFGSDGLLIGVIGALVGLLLPGRRLGLMHVLLSPFFYGFLLMLEDWYLFDMIHFSLGSPIQLDGQAVGMLLFCLGICVLPEIPYARILAKIKA